MKKRFASVLTLVAALAATGVTTASAQNTNVGVQVANISQTVARGFVGDADRRLFARQSELVERPVGQLRRDRAVAVSALAMRRLSALIVLGLALVAPTTALSADTSGDQDTAVGQAGQATAVAATGNLGRHCWSMLRGVSDHRRRPDDSRCVQSEPGRRHAAVEPDRRSALVVPRQDRVRGARQRRPPSPHRFTPRCEKASRTGFFCETRARVFRAPVPNQCPNAKKPPRASSPHRSSGTFRV